MRILTLQYDALKLLSVSPALSNSSPLECHCNNAFLLCCYTVKIEHFSDKHQYQHGSVREGLPEESLFFSKSNITFREKNLSFAKIISYNRFIIL